ncbi:MAG: electron transfer flavoprotein subunit alpha/FixB family protein, partial [Dehalococcoidia bacterium]
MDNKGILIYVEQEGGRVHPICYELLGKGRELADKTGSKVSCALLGSGVSGAAQELVAYGADAVYVFDDESLATFDSLAHKQNLVGLLAELKPAVVMFGATFTGTALAPRIATALEAGLTSNCTALELQDDGSLLQVRPAFTGNFLAHVKAKSVPAMVTVRYRALEAGARDDSRKGEIIKKDVQKVDSAVKVLGKGAAKEASIAAADVIVCAGRGLKKAEDFALVKQLADALGGVVGATRPLVDDGWISKDHQVGFSGTIAKPKLYVGVGVSGSPQHLAGMRESGTIV